MDDNVALDQTPLMEDSDRNIGLDKRHVYEGMDMETNSESSNIHKEVMPKRPPPFFVYTIAFFASIGGFLFGYDTGVVSGAMIFIRKEFNLDDVWQELIVSITIGAAALFALIGGFLTDYCGRKPTILISSVVFTAGAVCLGLAGGKITLLIGRFIVGGGIGLASMSVPVYIAETTPPDIRGRVVTLYNLFVTMGQFVASVVDGIFSYDTKNGWRYMLGLAGVPSAIQFIGFIFMPESPRWLVSKDKHEAARRSLNRIRHLEDVDAELEAIQMNHIESRRAKALIGDRSVIGAMLKDPSVRRALIVGCGLQMFQQISGINTVMYYSASIIKMAGIKNDSLAVWLAALVASINFLFSFVGLYFVEKVGRRKLTMASLLGTVISLAFLGVGFQLSAISSPAVVNFPHHDNKSVCDSYTFCDPCISNENCGFCYISVNSTISNGSCLATDKFQKSISLYGPCHTKASPPIEWSYGYCPTPYSWMAVAGLVLYLMAFAPGMGPMPWTINSEIYPLWARSGGVAAATATNWIFNLIIAMTFLSLTSAITKYGAFYLYTFLALMGLVFVGVTLPETKGKPLEEVQKLFREPFCGASVLEDKQSIQENEDS